MSLTPSEDFFAPAKLYKFNFPKRSSMNNIYNMEKTEKQTEEKNETKNWEEHRKLEKYL